MVPSCNLLTYFGWSVFIFYRQAISTALGMNADFREIVSAGWLASGIADRFELQWRGSDAYP